MHEPGKYPRDYEVLATSNRVEPGELLMSDAQMDQLRRHLEVIHDEFAELYGIEAGEKFAMEIEFKITSENVLSIKQARPWVFSHVEENSQATGKPAISGTARVDETLTAETSGIADADGLTNVVFRYQWIRNDGNAETEIQGATESTYELSNADARKTIKVRVSFTDDAEYEETLTSEATEAVAARPNSPATGLPAISGTGPGERDADGGRLRHRPTPMGRTTQPSATSGSGATATRIRTYRTPRVRPTPWRPKTRARPSRSG